VLYHRGIARAWLAFIIYSVRLSVHEDVATQGVNPPLQLLLPLNLTIAMNCRRHRRRRLRHHCCRHRLSAAAPFSSVPAKRDSMRLICSGAKLRRGRVAAERRRGE
jgi:hypothetical protein